MDGLNGWGKAMEEVVRRDLGMSSLMNASNASDTSKDVLKEINDTLSNVGLSVNKTDGTWVKLSDSYISDFYLDSEMLKKVGEAFIKLSKGI